MMRLFLIFVSAAILMLVVSLIVVPGATRPRTDSLNSVVELSDAHGLGSGVHIGNGYIVTAAHVAGENKSMTLTEPDGSKQDAEVLWINKTYDIALLKASDPSKLATSRLSCRTPHTGDLIKAQGNPVGVQFITVWGRIGGDVRQLGPWREVVVTDIAVVPGQSGGPVFGVDGEIVGVTVGVMVVPMGFGGSLVGVGYAVPASTVCGLLARTA